MILHIVFDEEDGAALTKSFDLEPSMKGEIVVIREDWSIGPLMGTIGDDQNPVGRDAWMKRLFDLETDDNSLKEITRLLSEDPVAQGWIWVAPNAKDVCGYYFLISKLKKYQGQIGALWLNNLPFINDKGQIFYPDFLREIPAKEFVKARRLLQLISGAIFETDPDEWEKLRRENKKLRILEGAKKISGKPDEYFDKRILSQLGAEWQKSSRLISHVFSVSRETTNPAFILWRIRELIHDGEMEARGDWPGSNNFDVRKIQEEQPATGDE